LAKAEATEEIIAKAKEITAGKNDNYEKIKSIALFIQNNIQYIYADLERGGFTPHSPKEILAARYGDCKDQTILLIALLKAVGIESFPALINPYPFLEFTQLPIPDLPNFILIPDQIRDPGNLGTLLRSAAATGVQAVLLPPETTDAFAPKVVRSGMGAHFRLPIRSLTWEEIEQVGKSAKVQMYLADMDGKSCWEIDLRQPLAMIVGGEAEGASREARKPANQRISIPMTGEMESLNAGVAGSVLMFEVVRQRMEGSRR
jgi:tRNA(Leu) C34 or U34 (ribose-2'-O)-methylase TrmL